MFPPQTSSPLASQLSGLGGPAGDPLAQAGPAAAGMMAQPGASGGILQALAALMGSGTSGLGTPQPPGEELADLDQLDQTTQALASGQLDAGQGDMGEGAPEAPGGLGQRMLAALLAAQQGQGQAPAPPPQVLPQAGGLDMNALLGGMKPQGPPMRPY